MQFIIVQLHLNEAVKVRERKKKSVIECRFLGTTQNSSIIWGPGICGRKWMPAVL